jgi:hypothetical protein
VSEFDPIDYAEQACADLTPEQINDVNAWLMGVFSTYVDHPHAATLTAARWRFLVGEAIRAARSLGEES